MKERFVQIDPAQMDEFLTVQGFTVMDMDDYGEVVYGKRVNKGDVKLSLRVLTSINRTGGATREKGTDAIRVELYRWNGKPQRIMARKNYRTVGWPKHLQANITALEAYEPKQCPEEGCNGILVPREGKHGEFLGCCNFPKCRHTENIG